MTLLRNSRSILIGAVAALAAGLGAGALAAPQAPTVQHLAQAGADAAAHPATGGETGQSRNAARSRMRECGHQWSSMKKNNTTAGLTWREFSQTCLAKP